MVRKYAFHMILAGHRFSKAGQVSRLTQWRFEIVLVVLNIVNLSI